jgi:hypothetical protein
LRPGGATQVYQKITHPMAVKIASTTSKSPFSSSIAGLPEMMAARRRGAPSSSNSIDALDDSPFARAPKLQRGAADGLDRA